MAERVLSQRALNRALLARQFLLERSELPLTRILERVGGIQAQYAPSTYVGLWSRLANFRRDDLTTALEQRRVVQATLMRSTIHVVSAADFWSFAEGVRAARREWWLAATRRLADPIDIQAVANRLRGLLAGGPLRRKELADRLAADGYPTAVWSGVGLWVDMVRVPPSGTWERRSADLYGLAEHWVGPPNATEADGQELLVRRYLTGFGPASLKDIASWAGLTPAAVRPAVEGLTLRRFRDEQGGELLDLPRAPLPDPETPAPVRFLPTWDATLLIHGRRTQILPERFRGLVFHTKTPHSVPTFLVDGAVAGTWRYEAGRVRLNPFETLPARVMKELEDEAERLAAFHDVGESAPE